MGNLREGLFVSACQDRFSATTPRIDFVRREVLAHICLRIALAVFSPPARLNLVTIVPLIIPQVPRPIVPSCSALTESRALGFKIRNQEYSQMTGPRRSYSNEIAMPNRRQVGTRAPWRVQPQRRGFL
jgi:hypothetical protein